jgi:hypothetical protein
MLNKKNCLIALATLIVAGITLAISEIGVRVISTSNPSTGMQLIGRVALLPYRPDAGSARASWDRAETSTYVVPDKDLGWAIKANGAAGEGDLYTATSHGFRGPKGWATTSSIAKGKLRISVYGDSFTHGDNVPLEDTWPDQLQHLRTDLEVLNFGVPGYGTDQAFLRFRRDGRKFDAQFHILGIMPEDIFRNLSVIRFYLTPTGNIGSSKPRFVLASGKLETVNSPVLSRDAFLDTVLQKDVSSVIKHDYWYRDEEQRYPFYYHLQTVRAVLSLYNTYQRRAIRNQFYTDPEGEALRVTAAIAEAFKNEVEDLGSRPYVIILPMRDLLDAHGSGAFPLVEMLKARSIAVLDAGPAFAAKAREVGADALYLPDGHLTALGNRLIAEEINRALSSEFDRALR